MPDMLFKTSLAHVNAWFTIEPLASMAAIRGKFTGKPLIVSINGTSSIMLLVIAVLLRSVGVLKTSVYTGVEAVSTMRAQNFRFSGLVKLLSRNEFDPL